MKTFFAVFLSLVGVICASTENLRGSQNQTEDKQSQIVGAQYDPVHQDVHITEAHYDPWHGDWHIDHHHIGK